MPPRAVPVAAQSPALERRPGLGGERRLEAVHARARPTARRRPRRRRAGRSSSAAPRRARPRAPRRSRRAARTSPARRRRRGRRRLEPVGARPDRSQVASSQPSRGRRPRRADSAAATRRTARPSTRGAGRRACRRRRRSAPRAIANAAQRRYASPSSEPGDRVAGDRAGQLRVTVPGQPGRRAVAVAEGARRVVGRERLVDVVEQRRRLDEPAIDGDRRAPRSAPPASRRPRPRRARAARTRAGDRGRAGGRRPPPARAPSSARWYPTVAGRTRSRGRRRPRRRRSAARRPAARARGRAPVTGIAHRNGGGAIGHARPRGVGRRASAARTRRDAAGAAALGPDRHPVRPRSRRRPMPSRSVRKTRAPAAASRSSVGCAGWPYGLPAPAEATATVGRTASTNGLRRGGPAAVMGDLEQVDAAAGRRPAATGRCPPRRRPSAGTGARPTWPSSTIETLLMPVPPSGGSSGTWPRIGHRTRSAISSTARRSPAARPSAHRRAGGGRGVAARRRSRGPARASPARRRGRRGSARGAGPGRRRGPRADATG